MVKAKPLEEVPVNVAVLISAASITDLVIIEPSK
jgi:hypothetical protein